MFLFNFLALLPLSPIIIGIGMLAVVLFTAKNRREDSVDELEKYSEGPSELNVSGKNAIAVDGEADIQDYLLEDIVMLFEKKQVFLRKGLKIDDVAHECMSNRTYVSSCINAYYGQTFTSLVNSFRVEYAKGLILSYGNTMKLRAVCSNSGFSDEVSFIRNFKKFTGMTPSEWCAANLARDFAS